jgi:hypothetical protein
MNWNLDEAEQALVEVRKRALIDKPFRQLLVASPNQAIERVTGKPVPPGCKIRVLEPDPNADLTFLLPRMVTEELSPEDLERVAGGSCADACAKACGLKAEK